MALKVKNGQKKSGIQQVECLILTCSGQFAESAFHKWNLLSKLLLIKFKTLRARGVYVVVQFYPWFKSYFPLF